MQNAGMSSPGEIEGGGAHPTGGESEQPPGPTVPPFGVPPPGQPYWAPPGDQPYGAPPPGQPYGAPPPGQPYGAPPGNQPFGVGSPYGMGWPYGPGSPYGPGTPYPPGYPYAYEPMTSPPGHGLAIASLVVGIASVPIFLFFALPGIAAVVLGFVSRHQSRPVPGLPVPPGRGMALAGIILGFVSIAGFVTWLSLAIAFSSCNC